MGLSSKFSHHSGTSALSTLTLLASSVFSPALREGHAHEQVQAPAQSVQVEKQHKVYTTEERAAIFNRIQKQPYATEEDKKATRMSELAMDLTQLRAAITSAKDMQCGEMCSLSQYAISTLNTTGFRGSLPKGGDEEFINSHVLTLHSTLIDKMQKDPPAGMDPTLRENRINALLADLLWSETYKSPAITDRACELFKTRVFAGNPEDCAQRAETFAERLEQYAELRKSVDLLDCALKGLQLFSEDGSYGNSRHVVTQQLIKHFALTPQQTEHLHSVTMASLQSGKDTRFLLEGVGPLWGVALVRGSSAEVAAKGSAPRLKSCQAVLQEVLEPTGKTSDPIEAPVLDRLPKHILEHALYATSAEKLGLSSDSRGIVDLETRQEQQLKSALIALGMLRGMDSALCEPLVQKEKEVVFRGIKFRVPEQRTPEEIAQAEEAVDPRMQVTALREKLRDALGRAAASRWDEEHRSTLVVALLVSDYERFELLEDQRRYCDLRLKELGEHFPAVIAATQEGRYASKIGGIAYYPPVQVEGSQAPHADTYFYLR